MSGLLGVARDVGRELELRHATEEQREIELTEAEKWARDPIGWLNTGRVWIQSKFSDTGKVRPVQLELFPDQVRTVEAWIDLPLLQKTGTLHFRNLAIEKSRQIGETWLFAALICWLLHYHDAVGGAMHTRSAEIQDTGWTTKSLFGKVRYIDGKLNREKVAGLADLDYSASDPPSIRNARRGSAIYGECQRDDPFRGQTLDYIVVDEAAFVAHGEKVYAALDEACPSGKALLSTVNGDGNFHARLCDERPAGWEYLRLHWSQHPLYGEGLHIAGERDGCALCEGTKRGLRWNPQTPTAHRYPGRQTSPWYDERVIGKTDEQVANELDIDRSRALAGRVYPEFSNELHVDPDGIPYEHDLMGKLELLWDFGLDVTSVVVCQDTAYDYRVIGLLEMGDLLGTSGVPEIVSETLLHYLADLGVPPEFLTQQWTRRIRCWGDPSEQDRNTQSGLPKVHAFRRLGWNIGAPPRRLTKYVSISVTSVKRLLLGSPKPLRVCAINAAEFATHMRNNTWPVDAAGRRQLGSTRPVDDLHNHACRAFAYGIVAKWPPPIDANEERAYPSATDEAAPTRAVRSRDRDGRLDPGLSYDQPL